MHMQSHDHPAVALAEQQVLRALLAEIERHRRGAFAIWQDTRRHRDRVRAHGTPAQAARMEEVERAARDRYERRARVCDWEAARARAALARAEQAYAAVPVSPPDPCVPPRSTP